MSIASTEVRQIGLLEADPELGIALPREAFVEARARLRVPGLWLGPGEWTPERYDGCFTVLVTNGFLLREMRIAHHLVAHPIGPGDLISTSEPEPESLASTVTWNIRSPSRVVCLDARYVAAVARWPQLTRGLARRAAQQADRLAIQQAICQMPRVEDRVLCMLWHLAERWGKVYGDGVALNLDLTHELLGRIIGARRPTVSLAVGKLVARGALARPSDASWLLIQRPDGVDEA